MIALLLSAAVAAVPAGAPREAPGWFLAKVEAQRVRAVLTFDAAFPKLRAKEWVLFVPIAPDLPGQSNASTFMVPRGTVVAEKSPLQRDVLQATIPADKPELAKKLSLRITYEATLYARKLRPLRPGAKPPVVPDLTEKERTDCLLAFGDLDYRKKGFQAWLKANQLLRRDGEGEVEFARRVFLMIRSKFTYDYRLEMDRSAEAVCAAGKSDCGGLSILFAAALRANGIPARVLYGRWAASSKEGDTTNGVPYHQSHAQAEFFARGVGWVPVDPAIAIVHDRSKDGLTYFGYGGGNFITMHVDPNVRLDTKHFGTQEVHCLQSAAYWVSGAGSLDGERIVQDWKVQKIK